MAVVTSSSALPLASAEPRPRRKVRTSESSRERSVSRRILRKCWTTCVPKIPLNPPFTKGEVGRNKDTQIWHYEFQRITRAPHQTATSAKTSGFLFMGCDSLRLETTRDIQPNRDRQHAKQCADSHPLRHHGTVAAHADGEDVRRGRRRQRAE